MFIQQLTVNVWCELVFEEHYGGQEVYRLLQLLKSKFDVVVAPVEVSEEDVWALLNPSLNF